MFDFDKIFCLGKKVIGFVIELKYNQIKELDVPLRHF